MYRSNLFHGHEQEFGAGFYIVKCVNGKVLADLSCVALIFIAASMEELLVLCMSLVHPRFGDMMKS